MEGRNLRAGTPLKVIPANSKGSGRESRMGSSHRPAKCGLWLRLPGDLCKMVVRVGGPHPCLGVMLEEDRRSVGSEENEETCLTGIWTLAPLHHPVTISSSYRWGQRLVQGHILRGVEIKLIPHLSDSQLESWWVVGQGIVVPAWVHTVCLWPISCLFPKTLAQLISSHLSCGQTIPALTESPEFKSHLLWKTGFI
jgi:hypothetical protein